MCVPLLQLARVLSRALRLRCAVPPELAYGKLQVQEIPPVRACVRCVGLPSDAASSCEQLRCLTLTALHLRVSRAERDAGV